MPVDPTREALPELTPDEKVTAQAELQRWPEGEIVPYQGDSGKELQGRLYRPAGAPSATIVALHGLETHAKWFALLAQELNAWQIAVLAIDRRGSGLNKAAGSLGQLGPNETPTWLGDLSGAARAAAGFGAPVYMLGNSWGAHPVLAWSQMAEAPQLAQGVFLLTPGLLAHKPTQEQGAWIGNPTSDQQLFGTCLSREDYSDKRATWALLMGDPDLTRDVSARFFGATRAMHDASWAHLDQVKIPVGVIYSELDALMRNAEIKEALRQGVPSVKEETLAGAHHLALIENTKEVATKLAAWIQSVPRSRPAFPLVPTD